MSAVEDVATAIAATVRAKGWYCTPINDRVLIDDGLHAIANLYCKDASQAKRLAEMMRGEHAPA